MGTLLRGYEENHEKHIITVVTLHTPYIILTNNYGNKQIRINSVVETQIR